eukprot:15527884-Heterocapsa_arctica.AAC.1
MRSMGPSTTLGPYRKGKQKHMWMRGAQGLAATGGEAQPDNWYPHWGSKDPRAQWRSTEAGENMDGANG